MRHPIQRLYKDEYGCIRFKGNDIVKFLLDAGPYDINDLCRIGFKEEDYEQFAQLIGYSLCGLGDLSYVSYETYEEAEKAALSLTHFEGGGGI